jgi:hypothetical protein
MDAATSLAARDDHLDRLVNIDAGGRGVEHLHDAARVRLGRSPVGAAADLLERGVEVDLINSVDGIIDPNVDTIPLATHLAVVELIATIVGLALG